MNYRFLRARGAAQLWAMVIGDSQVRQHECRGRRRRLTLDVLYPGYCG
jgi:hypothetical protein